MRNNENLQVPPPFRCDLVSYEKYPLIWRLRELLLLRNMQIWWLVTIWQADTAHDSLALADQLWLEKRASLVIPFLRFVRIHFRLLYYLHLAHTSSASILIVNLKSCMTKNDDQRQYAFIFIRVSFIIRDEEEAVNSHFSSGDLQRRKDALVRWSLLTSKRIREAAAQRLHNASTWLSFHTWKMSLATLLQLVVL